MIRERFGHKAVEPSPVPDAAQALVARTRFELVPMRGVDAVMADLAPGAPVSVTCSPVKGITATQELTARLLDVGHDVVPHLSARMVEGPEHVARLAAWIRAQGLREVFVVAGDAERPHGPYADGATFLRDLLAHDPGLVSVGVPGYPDGHPLIDDDVLRSALRAKQSLLQEAGVAGSVTTQMCLDPARIRQWLVAARAGGMVLPVDLGVPGVVERAKLMTMGVRLGVGASLRFLRKHRSTVTALLAPGGYDPTELVVGVAEDAARLGVVGLHAFTFNRVATTRAWQEQLLP